MQRHGVEVEIHQHGRRGAGIIIDERGTLMARNCCLGRCERAALKACFLMSRGTNSFFLLALGF